MQNTDLTKWLQMVWNALAEQDEVRRNSMLRSAEMFLTANNQKSYGFRSQLMYSMEGLDGPGETASWVTCERPRLKPEEEQCVRYC
jgi:hypothetical protein